MGKLGIIPTVTTILINASCYLLVFMIFENEYRDIRPNYRVSQQIIKKL